MEVNKLSEIRRESNASFVIMFVFMVLSIMTYIIYPENNLFILFIVSAAMFRTDMRYWDIKYHLIKNLKKLK